MAKGELIDDHVSLAQCKKAVQVLHSHETKKMEKFEETQLLPGKEQHIWLNVTVKTVLSAHRLKPVKIPIVHPLVDPRTNSVCLITKDPQREYKDLLEKHNIKFISRVVGLEKLKGKFKPFEARRILLKENGLFLADDRVIPLLPKLLGSKWFEAKKQPIPVNLQRKDLKGELERAISSTYMNQNQGTNTAIKVGKMSQKPSQIVDNIKKALPAIAKAIKGGWENIQNLSIKTSSSVSLPIWSCALDDGEGGRWHGLLAEPTDDEDEEKKLDGGSERSDEESELPNTKKDSSAKARKRTTHSDDEEDDKPKKKAKAVDGTSKTKNEQTPTAKKAGKSASPSVDAPPSKKQKVPSPSIPVPKKSADSAAKKSAGPSETEKRSHPQKPASASSSPMSTESAKSSSVSEPLQKTRKERKKSSTKVAESAVSEQPVSKQPTLTKEELKQKRSATIGEKKKDNVMKAKLGKSAKNSILGKKPGKE